MAWWSAMTQWVKRCHISLPSPYALLGFGRSVFSSAIKYVFVVLAAIAVYQGSTWAATYVAGDLAPLNNPDGSLNAADAVILQRLILGDLTPTQTQLLVGDVAPLGAPDGELNAGDLVVLMRAIQGLIALPEVSFGPSSPTLNPISATTNVNPYTVTGGAVDGLTIRLYINNVLRSTTVASSGAFNFEAALFDGPNSLYATTWDGVAESAPSNVLSIDYINDIPRTQSGTVITQNTVWTPGDTPAAYVISDVFEIAPGASLIIQPGTILSFASGASMVVNGGLEIRGKADARVLLTSSGAQIKGAWAGIVVNNSSTNTVIDYAQIEYAKTGVLVDDANVTIRNSLFRSFGAAWGDAAIRLANGASGLISDNDISTTNPTSESGIYLEQSSPTIAGNTIQSVEYGITVAYGSHPTINGENLITGNVYGVYINGDYWYPTNDPMPSIRGNSIFGNTAYNIIVEGYASPELIEIDVSDNWWGSADPNVFTPKVYDYKNGFGTYTPVLKFVPFRSAAGGPLQSGNYLNGILPDGFVVSPGQTYEAVGSLAVLPGSTLNVNAGSVLRFADSSLLYVSGQIQVQGSSSTKVIFTSSSPAPVTGSWQGIWISNETANSTSLFNYAIFEYAGVMLNYGSALITDSEFQYATIDMQTTASSGEISRNIMNGHNVSGVGVIARAANLSISDNKITNYTSGISISAGISLVTGNTIQNNQYGVIVTSPNKAVSISTINSGNLITLNDYGVYIDTGGSTSSITVNDNSIYDNQINNLYAKSYGVGLGAINYINATNNWWGTEDPQALVQTIFDQTDAATTSTAESAPFVDYSPMKAANLSSINANMMLGVLDGSMAVDAGTSLTLAGSILVPPSTTLTLGEGAQLLFPLRSSLVVKGDISSAGTGDNPVVLSSTKPAGTQVAGDWYGVIVNADNVSIENTRVDYAQHGLSVFASAGVSITNCQISDYFNEGILMTYLDVGNTRTVSSGVISDNTITNGVSSSGYGIYAIKASPLIANNIISNGSTGIRLQYTNTSNITGNVIRDNKNYGIYLTSGYLANPGSNSGLYYDPQPIISNNNVYGNNFYPTSSYNLYLYRVGLNSYSGNPGTYTLNAANNWWGSDVESEIAPTIKLYTDKVSISPTINHIPFLAGPIPSVPSIEAGSNITNNPSYTITGNADAGLDVRIYVNNTLQLQVPVDSAGSYNAQVTLQEGANSLYAKTYNGTNESNASSTVSVTLDTLVPVISVAAPTDGERTNNYVKIIGSLSEAANLVIAGQPGVVSTTNTFSHGPVVLAEGGNVLTLEATDLAGNVGALTVNVTLDTTPPTNPVVGLISYDDSIAGQATLTGAAGSVQGTTLVTLVNARSGQASLVTSNPDGSFTLAVSVTTGDKLYLLAADDVGNQTAWLDYTVAGSPPPLAVTITTPMNGATIPGGNVNVTGTITGPINAGVNVNGVVATITNGTFVATNVAIASTGSTAITVTATAPDDVVVTQSITVNKGVDLPVEMSVSPDVGLSPLLVTFAIDLVGTYDIGSVEFDADGDGTFEITGPDITYTWGKDIFNNDIVIKASATHIYVGQNIYNAKARIYDVSGLGGTTYNLEHPVVVRDAIGVGANLRRLYTIMQDYLIVGYPEGALRMLSQAMQEKYTALFTNQAIDFSQLIPQLGEVVGGGVSDDLGYLIVKRTEGAQDLYFTVYYERGDDGVWRIGEM